MSSDQRPGKIKIVATSEAAQVPAPAGRSSANIAQAQAQTASSDANAPASSGFPLIGTILFLVGCALGGLVLVAWPHIAG